MHRPLAALVVLLAGCSFYDDTPDTNTDPIGSAGDPTCSEEITSPLGPTGVPGAAPQAHAETYGAEPAPFQVRYQWPTSRPDVSAGFLWRTDTDTLATVVEWGEGTELTERTEGMSLIFGDSNDFDGFRIHEVRLCGKLTPATTYSYRVGGDEAWSDTYTFTTPGAPDSFDTVTIGIVGDSRGAYTTWASLLESMEAFDPDLYMFSGDMVEFGVVQAEWDSWFEAAGDLWATKVLVPAHGNHEFLARNYFAQFALPGNEEWFSLDYGPLHLVSLNDTVRNTNDIYTFQTNFLATDLVAHDRPWTFVQHHQPIYSACTRHGSQESLREAWGPEFDAGDVDVVVAGHNHIYERSVRITAEQEAADGTTYLVAGGGGAPLYEESDDTWFNLVANPIEHYIIAEITGNTATFTVRDLDDNVLDTFTLTK
jgi:hypothetical protein